MVEIFAQHHCDTREAGQLYAAWRKGSPAIHKRILDEPEPELQRRVSRDYFQYLRHTLERLPPIG
jgi:hypothetical protein